MEINLKQRLIGAAVLIALGVIFIPMLLDGAGWRERKQMDLDLPAEPKFTFDRALPPMPDSGKPKGSASNTPGRKGPAEAGEASPGGHPVVVKKASPDKAARPEPGRRAEVKSTPQPPVARAAARPSKPPPAAPAASAPARAPGWVVQVGSFSKKANAESLVRRLRASGYKAFVDPYGSGSSHRYRVKVGPEKDKPDAEAVRKRLRSSERLTGLVLSYP